MRCQVAIGVIAAIVMFAPRPDMDFVDIQRRVQPIQAARCLFQAPSFQEKSFSRVTRAAVLGRNSNAAP